MSRSWWPAPFLLVAFGCADQPSGPPPGVPPVLKIANNLQIGDSRWWKNEPQQLEVSWVNGIGSCEGFGCDPPETLTLRVDAVRCHGCTVVDDPSGASTVTAIDFNVIPTDDLVTVDVDVTDLGSGSRATVSERVSVDHEVGLQLRCRLVDRLAVQNSVASDIGIDGWPDQHSFRDCASSRTPGQAVALFPEIVTHFGDTVFPFTPDGGYDSDHHARFLSTLHISVPPDGWDDAGNLETSEFGYYLELGNIHHIDVTTQLAGGPVVSATVAIPPLCDLRTCPVPTRGMDAPAP
jgi:hypothetical protein